MSDAWKAGDLVRITGGPFDGLEGEVLDLFPSEATAEVRVSIFGRQVPVKVGLAMLARCGETSDVAPPVVPPPPKIGEVLDRLTSWLRAHVPSALAELRPGVGEDELDSAGHALGRPLPADVRSWYRWANGTPAPSWTGESMTTTPAAEFWSRFIGGRMLSLAEVVETHAECCAYGRADWDDPFQPGWWNDAWIPVATNDNSDWLCVDAAGVWTGTSGQLIQFWHDMDMRPINASSLAEWFDARVRDLEEGTVVDAAGQLVDDPDWRAPPGYSLYAYARFAPLVPRVRRIEGFAQVRVTDPASPRFGQVGQVVAHKSGSWLMAIAFNGLSGPQEEFQLGQLEEV